MKEKDEQAKGKMKENADRRSRAKESEIQVGDTVLLRQRKKNKWSTRFDPAPFQVVRRKGTMVTVVRNEKYVTRNVSQFKKISSAVKGVASSDEDDGDDFDEEEGEIEQPLDELSPDNPIQPVNSPVARRYPQRERHATQRYVQNIYDQ